jgi:hypothetical protein
VHFLKAIKRSQGLGMQICRTPGFAPGARRKGDPTGSRWSKPLLKDLDFQISSKYFQAFASSSKIPIPNMLEISHG